MQSINKNKIKKLIYAASASCYGIPKEYPTKENSKINPMYPYAFTKWQGEELIKHWSKIYNIPYISLRFFNAYGPRSRTITSCPFFTKKSTKLLPINPAPPVTKDFINYLSNAPHLTSCNTQVF